MKTTSPCLLRLLTATASILCLASGSSSAAPVQGFTIGLSLGSSEIRTYSGLNTTPTSDFLAFSPTYTGGVFVGGGDINSDGFADVIVGADVNSSPVVKTISGKDGTTLSNFFAFSAGFTGGVRVAGGDVNHDGYADIIAATGPGGSPQVSVFSGKDGSLLSSFLGLPLGSTGGVFVASGDVNHDGYADIVTGAGAGDGTLVRVYSGANGSILYSFLALNPSFTGGVYVASGDIDGDGFSDIIVGSGAGDGSLVDVYSGQDGSLLRSFQAYGIGYTSGVRVAAADLNGDGKDDIITATGPGVVGEVKAFDSTTLGTLVDFTPYGPSYTNGLTVSGLVVPEPASTMLVLLGGVGLLTRRRQNRCHVPQSESIFDN